METHAPTIGLEIHAELKTKTKMFCDSRNDPDEKRPNANVCPVCMGHPGTLPTINKAAVKHVLRLGVALGGTLADRTEFDRKNYFYPDLPKGYQISQYKLPLVEGGELLGVAITRIHLEEDTARSLHDGDRTLVDFNRAGIPLMELVTEPVIRDGKTAAAFAKELQLLLRFLGAGEANLEKGEMRIEANVSVSPAGGTLGTKVEVKNLNSFRAVERAIAHEIARQSQALAAGERVVQETRGWDDARGVTVPQRLKEESHDYRYFPDPDLPPRVLSKIPEFSPAALREELPELPWERRERLMSAYGVSREAADIYVSDEKLHGLFSAALQNLAGRKELARRLSNYITSDIAGARGSAEAAIDRLSPADLAKLVLMEDEGKLSSRGVKDAIAALMGGESGVERIVSERGLLQESSEKAIAPLVEKVLAENPAAVAEYRAGKANALEYLIGAAMRASRGTNPKALRRAILAKLG